MAGSVLECTGIYFRLLKVNKKIPKMTRRAFSVVRVLTISNSVAERADDTFGTPLGVVPKINFFIFFSRVQKIHKNQLFFNDFENRIKILL